MKALVVTFNQEKALVRENRWIICSSSLATATAGDKLEEFSRTGARPEDGGIMAGRGILKILRPTDTMIDRTNSTVTATNTIPQSHG